MRTDGLACPPSAIAPVGHCPRFGPCWSATGDTHVDAHSFSRNLDLAERW